MTMKDFRLLSRCAQDLPSSGMLHIVVTYFRYFRTAYGSFIEGKGKVRPRTGNERPEAE
jgi:hypothetical protein